MTKVLLVEDDNNLREIYEARLTAEGYEISTAQDGEEALVVAKQLKPDLVISDVMMPKISGFEMLDILRNTPGLEHVKVIMLTALGQGEDRDRADSLGANKYLVKSQVTLEDIVKTAQELLAGDDEGLPSGITQDTAPSAAAATPSVPSVESPAATESMAAESVAPETPVVEAPVVEPIVAEPTPATEAPVVETPAPVVETPAEATVAEPTSSSAVATGTDETKPGSAAQETALVEQQIDSFAQQPAAAPAPAVTTEATVNETTAVTTEPVAPADTAADATSASDAAADDKLMADAVEQLSGNETTEPALTPIIQPATQSPSPAPELPTDQPATVAEPSATVEPSAPNIAITGKKVIQPLSGAEQKPDIHELLAREEAGTPPAPVTETPADSPAPPVPELANEAPAPQPSPASTPETPAAASPVAAPATPATEPAIDPNSIAL